VGPILKRGAAEFLVVVLGVLVALAVDDWRSSRIDRETERHVLERLAGDLLLDSMDIADAMGQAAQRMVAGMRVLERLGEDRDVVAGLREAVAPFDRDTLMAGPPNPREGIDATANDLQLALLTYVFDPTRAAFMEMAANGTLDLIEDRQLRDAVVTYYGRLEIVQEGDFKYREAERDYRLALRNAGVGFGDFYTERNLDGRLKDRPAIRTELRNVIGIAIFQSHSLRGTEERRAVLADAIRNALAALQ